MYLDASSARLLALNVMPDWLLDWGWKAGAAAAQALMLALFRSPKISGDRCQNCNRCNDYKVVGGLMRGVAMLLGVGGAAFGIAGAIMLALDKISLELGVGVIVLGFFNEIMWLRIWRQQRNALKCIACGDVQPVVRDDYEDEQAYEQEVVPGPQSRRKGKGSGKPRKRR